MTDALQFVFNQLLKDIWISIPGIIESYNQSTKRCIVTPAIKIRKTDGTTETQSSIVNVPVVWPSGGGFAILSPLPKGTPVKIWFSQRGITAFKETFTESDPGGRLFDKEDACVVAGYGSLEVTPATPDGISMQTEDGTNYIFVEDGNIEINATTKVTVNAPLVDVNAPDVTVDSTTITMTATDINMNSQVSIDGDLDITGIITGSAVFGGSDSDAHTHEQEDDSGGNTEEDTGVPK